MPAEATAAKKKKIPRIFKVINKSVEPRWDLSLVFLLNLSMFLMILAVYYILGKKADSSGESSFFRNWIQTTVLGDKYPLQDMLELNQQLQDHNQIPLFERFSEIDQYESSEELSTKKFFNRYLRKSRPVYIKNLAKSWPAYSNWRNDSYLMQKAGDDKIEVEEIDRKDNEFAYFLKKYGKQSMTYNEFMEKMSNETRTRNYYFAEQEVPIDLQKDIIEPKYGAEMMKTEATYYWDGIGTISLPHQDDAENIMCVMTGYKDFYMVSPFESDHVNAGQKKGYPMNYSPCNLLTKDMSKGCSKLDQANILYQRIMPGDCLFIPSNWWHQVNSSPERTLAISHWWKSHSPMITPIFTYLSDTAQ